MATSSSNAGAGNEGINLTDTLQDCFAYGVFTIDAQGTIGTVTPLARRLMGHADDPTGTLPVPALPPSMLAIISQAQKSGQTVTGREINFQTPGPNRTSLSVTAIPFAQAGRPTPVLVLLQIFPPRASWKSTSTLDRLASIGTLSASMAHEIKNALVPVRTFVGLTLEKNPEAELAGTARREMERLDGIVSRMLKFAAPAKPAFAPVRLHGESTPSTST